MKNPKKIYEKRVNYYTKLIGKINKTINTISILRLLSAIAAIICIAFIIDGDRDIITLGVSLLFTVTFLYLIYLHQRYKGLYNHVKILRDINLESIDRLLGKWNNFGDAGDEFINKNHRYSYDLDIFGKGSLFQMINTSKTFIGRNNLAKILSNPPMDKDFIEKRQESIKELSNKRWFRQRLQSEAMMISDDRNKEDLINFANNNNEVYLNPMFIILIRIAPIITILSVILAFVFNIISINIPIILLLIQFTMIFIGGKVRNREFSKIYIYNRNIKVYRRILEHFEKGNFKTDYLNELSSSLKNEKGISSIRQLKKLESLVESILNKGNIMYFPLNILTLWDYQNMISLEKWKLESGNKIDTWLNVIGEIESLSSLSILGYDNPDWGLPEIYDKPSIFRGRSLGHPLLTNKRVSNDVKIDNASRVLLITGSNMSGKSTLLRTVGINLVLAYSGAVICGKEMKTSMMEIHTCMRINDDLEKGISSFYGELLRIKEIVKASEEKTRVFFLLDEIFKGTNSYDRHIGAKTLIKQLYNNEAMGMVSTHDLELEVLEKESNGVVKNYHFQEQYNNGKIQFDYKLKSGVSTTRNALYLMKMIGIDTKKP